MIRLRHRFFFVLLLVCPLYHVPALEATTPLRLLYQSPSSGSAYGTPLSTIIIRPVDRVAPKCISPDRFTVTGSISGVHGGVVRLSDDDQTITFTPLAPYSAGETISVEIQAGLETTSGEVLGSYTFWFYVAEQIPIGTALSAVDVRPYGDDISSQAKGNATEILFNQDSIPSTFPGIVVTTNTATAPGAIFVGNFNAAGSGSITNYVMILNNDGTPIWYKKLAKPVDTPPESGGLAVQPNGWLTYYDGATEKWYAMDSSYNVVDSFACGNGRPTDCHELQILANHHVLLMSYQPMKYDMSKVVAEGDTAAILLNDYIQELDASKNVVFEWNAMEHFKITDASSDILLTGSAVDPFHCNSIALDSDGALIISSRDLSEITKVDRATGNIIWRLGGANNQFKFTDDVDSPYFANQHDARPLPGETLTLFDDGNLHSPPFSRAVQYHLDTTAKTCKLEWEYRDTLQKTPVKLVYTLAAGSNQLLPNGNRMIGWGILSNPAVTEVQPDGTKVYEMSFVSPNASYRAYRFPWRGATQSVAATAAPAGLTLAQNYPNPFGASAGHTSIEYTIEKSSHVSLKVYDLTGREMASLVDADLAPGNYRTTFTTGVLPSGLYSYALTAEGKTLTRNMLLVR